MLAVCLVLGITPSGNPAGDPGGDPAGEPAARAARGTTHVVLLIGQSNMAGRAQDHSSVLDPGDPRIRQFTARGVLARAAEPLGHPDPRAGGGPGLAFARAYLAGLPASDSILLVPAAYGGTGFSTPDSHGTDLSWDATRPRTRANLFERSLTQLRRAVRAVAARGPVQVDGVLVNLGGTDALNHLSGPTFRRHLDTMVAAYRRRLSRPGLPFVLGPSRPDVVATNSWYAGINAVQRATPGRVARTAYVPGAVGTRFYKPSDTVHYNQVGHRAMGPQYARALLGIRRGLPVLRAPTQLTAGAALPTSLRLRWAHVRGATGYEVRFERRSSPGWRSFGLTAARSAQVLGLVAGETYEVRVRAVDGSLHRGPARVVTAATAPAPPSS